MAPKRTNRQPSLLELAPDDADPAGEEHALQDDRPRTADGEPRPAPTTVSGSPTTVADLDRTESERPGVGGWASYAERFARFRVGGAPGPRDGVPANSHTARALARRNSGPGLFDSAPVEPESAPVEELNRPQAEPTPSLKRYPNQMVRGPSLLDEGSEEPLSPDFEPEAGPTRAPPAPAVAPQFSPGEKGKARHLLAAIRTLQAIEREKRPATADEQEALAQFPGFGPVALSLFPNPVTGHYKDTGWQLLGEELRALLTPTDYASAKRTTFSAFYTSLIVIVAIHSALGRLGVPDDALVLEPGCGSGNFLTSAEDGLLVSLDRKGAVDLPFIESLYGKPPDMIVAELGVHRVTVSEWIRAHHAAGPMPSPH